MGEEGQIISSLPFEALLCEGQLSPQPGRSARSSRPNSIRVRLHLVLGWSWRLSLTSKLLRSSGIGAVLTEPVGPVEVNAPSSMPQSYQNQNALRPVLSTICLAPALLLPGQSKAKRS